MYTVQYIVYSYTVASPLRLGSWLSVSQHPTPKQRKGSHEIASRCIARIHINENSRGVPQISRLAHKWRWEQRPCARRAQGWRGKGVPMHQPASTVVPTGRDWHICRSSVARDVHARRSRETFTRCEEECCLCAPLWQLRPRGAPGLYQVCSMRHDRLTGLLPSSFPAPDHTPASRAPPAHLTALHASTLSGPL